MTFEALIADAPVYFLDLHSSGDAGPEDIANNFYWLSTKLTCSTRPKHTWYVTPNKSFADLTALNDMSKATVQSSVSFKSADDGQNAEVTLKNTGDTLTFIEMRIVGGQSQQSLTPVLDDNYVSLPPHTTKVFHAHFPAGEKPELKLHGWNVKFENTGM